AVSRGVQARGKSRLQRTTGSSTTEGVSCDCLEKLGTVRALMSADRDPLADFDPFSPEVIADPAPFYARMRATRPVFRVPQGGFYLVTRYEDVVAAARDTDTFSNRFHSPGLALGQGSQAIQAELEAILAGGYPRTPTLLTNDP